MLDVGEDTSNVATAICVPGVVGHCEHKNVVHVWIGDCFTLCMSLVSH